MTACSSHDRPAPHQPARKPSTTRLLARIAKRAGLALVLGGLAAPLGAQVWQTASDGAWTDPATWVNPGVPEPFPDAGSTVEVDHDVSVDAHIVTANLTIGANASCTLTVLYDMALDHDECTVSASSTLKLEEYASLAGEVLRFTAGSKLVITPDDGGLFGFEPITVGDQLRFEGGASPPRTLVVQPTYPEQPLDTWKLFDLVSASVIPGGDGELFNAGSVKNSILEPIVWVSDDVYVQLYEPPLIWVTDVASGNWSDPSTWIDNGSFGPYPEVASEVFVDGDITVDVMTAPYAMYLGNGGQSTLRFGADGYIENDFGYLSVENGSKLIVDSDFDLYLDTLALGDNSRYVFRPVANFDEPFFVVDTLDCTLDAGGVSVLKFDPQYELAVGDSYDLIFVGEELIPDDNGDIFGVVQTPPGVLVELEYIIDGIEGELRLTVTQTEWSEVGTPADVIAGDAPRIVVAPDLDGDGALDLVSVNREGDDVSVLLGHGDGQFDAPVSYPVGDRPMDIVSADFDGDGAPDIATTVVNDDKLTVRLGAGDGTLLAPIDHGVPTPLGMDVGDLDEDGVPDLVVADRDGDLVHVLTGFGDGTFANAGTGAAPSTPRDVVLGDVDTDGHLDVVSSNTGSGQISALLGLGDGTLSPGAQFSAGGTPAQHELADVDGNGTLDAVIAITSSPTVSILPGLGNGSFGAPVSVATSTTPTRLAFGDIDADGLGDLLVTSGPGDTLSWFRGQAGFGFDAAEELDTGAYPAGVLIQDLNADEKPDMVVACRDDDLLQYFASTSHWARLPGGIGGLLGTPDLVGSGFLAGGEDVTLELSGALPFATCFLFIGLSRIDLPFKGGVMVPAPDFVIDVLSTDGTGGFLLPLTWDEDAPGGFSFWTQAWLADATAPAGAAGTNGLRCDVP